MARSSEKNGYGWDFIEVGKVYQYKEDGLIGMVRILEDNSNDEQYKFKIKFLKATYDFPEPIEISSTKGMTGCYSGMVQFYPEGHEEYVMLPIGTPYKFNYEG